VREEGYSSQPEVRSSHLGASTGHSSRLGGGLRGRDGRHKHRRGRRNQSSTNSSGVNMVRANSRVGLLLREFGSKEDWVSRTILRHKLATVIQACVRGWLVRKRWRFDPDRVVRELHAKLHAEATAKARREELRRKLEAKLLTQKQKKTATTVVSRMFGAKAFHLGRDAPSMGAKAGSLAMKWGRLRSNMDIAVREAEEVAEAADSARGGGGGESDSDFSDLEMEDITAVKLRARTPPWQKVEQSQWVGQYNKLNQKTMRGNLDVLWDIDECADRLSDVRARRLARDPEAASNAADEETFDPATQDLPPTLINDLLYDRYLEKYTRLGLAHRNPVKPGEAKTEGQSTGSEPISPSGSGRFPPLPGTTDGGGESANLTTAAGPAAPDAK